MTEIICITTDDKLKQRLDILRGDVPRSKFIVRILESQIREIDKATNQSPEKKLENINFADDILQINNFPKKQLGDRL